MTVTRFAPSNTGKLHLGGARTALFSWLHARHNGGKFLLRIEDTDTARSDPELIAPILHDLEWLGLDWDDDVVFQSQNVERHVEIAQELLRKGFAYRDYTTDQEIATKKAEWESNPKNKGPFRYVSRFRDSKVAYQLPHVIRIKAPTGFVEIDDLVQGKVRVNFAEVDDYVILRTDGSPTFLLAGVVDDYDMGVDTVIRGDDHLSNTFRQICIHMGMGWEIPTYAHIPLIHNEEGKKLSKRDGDIGIEDFRADYLPEAMFNYLVKLGWGHGNDEYISREQAIEWFEISAVGRGPARLDLKKLAHLNSHYIRCADASRFGNFSEAALRIFPEVVKRSETISEVKSHFQFLDHAPYSYWRNTSPLVEVLQQVEWEHDALDAALRAYADQQNIKFRDVMSDIRVMLTGRTHHIGVYDILLALGKTKSLSRMSRKAPDFVHSANWPTDVNITPKVLT